jgi:transcriptional regulator with XRE-family HTH domain
MNKTLERSPKKNYTPPFWAPEVKARMKAQNISQEFIAAKLGVARSAVGHYFSGKNALPISSVETFREYVGVSRDLFFEIPVVQTEVNKSNKVKDDIDGGLSTHAVKAINAIKALDKNGKLTKEISNSIATLLKSYN